jgi:putative peptide zinc metalloprotease protein
MVTDDALRSPDWFRVSGLALRLRPTVRVARQRLRGESWYVYRDEASGRQLRLNGPAHRFAARLDGQLTVGRLWERLLEESGDDAPSQHEIVALVQQLADGSLVSIDHGAELSRLARRETERRRRRLLSSVNPLAFKVRLFDPGPLLERTWRVAAPLYTGWALLAYLAILLTAAAVALEHAAALGAYAAAHVPTPGFALALLLVYPPLKAVHELAHAWAVRVWGGRVPEIGVTLLFGMPVPYVDASAAALFASRAQRVAVDVAGILAELLMAALALWVWLSVEDGGLRTAAFAVMTIGAVSTLFVNGNPLMRFDAYFALSDAIGVPNLAERSRQAWIALARRTIAGERGAPLPPGPRRDLPGLLAYGLASWAYRIAVMLWLVTLIVPHSRTVAAVLAAWAAWHAFGRAAWQAVRWLWRVRWQSAAPGRAITGTAIAAAGIALLLAGVPVPDATTLPGVVMPADSARVRAAEPGRVVDVLVSPGQAVRAGEPLVRMDSDALRSERDRLKAAFDGQRAEQIRTLVAADRTASGVAQDEIDRTRARLRDVESRLERLLVRAPADGVVAFVDTDGPLERQVRQGEALLYVLQPDSMRIQALARDDQARRLSTGAIGAQAQLGDTPGRRVALQLSGQVPQAVWVLPGAALAERAGGPIATDPADRDGLRTLEPWFQLEFVPAAALARVGASAEVRILHPPRPVFEQMADAVRRLFLRRFEG